MQLTKTNHVTYIDMLGTTVSDTAWVLRFIDNQTVFSNNSDGTGNVCSFGISSTTGNYASNQDFIGLGIALGSNNEKLNQNDVDGTALSSSVGGTLATASSVDERFTEIIRLTATSYSISLSTTSSYTGDIESANTRTGMPSTTDTLRYAKVALHSNDTTPNGDLTGTIKNWQFADGVTVAP